MIRRLGLVRHPEGGWYRETLRDNGFKVGTRAASTAIYDLLQAGEVSRWHRIDTVGLALVRWRAAEPTLSVDGRTSETLVLGPDHDAEPQRAVPAGVWQTARSLGAWTLAGCTVAPGFEFASFEMAPETSEPR